MRKVSLLTIVLIVFCFQLGAVGFAANIDVTGGTSDIGEKSSDIVYAFPITISTPQIIIQNIGVNWGASEPGYVRVALYTAESGKPANLLVDSGTVPIITSPGWQDIPVSYSITAGSYWVAIQISVNKAVYTKEASRSYYGKAFGPFDETWRRDSRLDYQGQWNMRVTSSSPYPQRLEQQNQINVSPAALPVGSYWSGSGTVHRALQGTGTYAGNWTEDRKYTNKFTIMNRYTDSIMVLVEYSLTWSNAAKATWIERNGGESNQGSIAPISVYYTIDLTTMRITAASSNQAQKRGRLTYLFIDPSQRTAATVPGDWYGLTVPFGVDPSQMISINGVDVVVRPVVYGGDGYGYWPVRNFYPTGRETIMYLYDETYGIVVGWTTFGRYVYVDAGGGWNETFSDNFRVSDTNINFPHAAPPSTSSFPMQPNILGGIVVALVAVVVAFVIMQKRILGHAIARLRQLIQGKSRRQKNS